MHDSLVKNSAVLISTYKSAAVILYSSEIPILSTGILSQPWEQFLKNALDRQVARNNLRCTFIFKQFDDSSASAGQDVEVKSHNKLTLDHQMVVFF